MGKACYNSQAFKQCTGGSMDRASDSGSEGWGFESLPVYQKADTHLGIRFLTFSGERDSNDQMQGSSGALLVAGWTAATP